MGIQSCETARQIHISALSYQCKHHYIDFEPEMRIISEHYFAENLDRLGA